jgi:hypothetical protein
LRWLNNGKFSIVGLAPGQYKLRFADYFSGYCTTYNGGASSLAAAPAISVTEGNDTAGVNVTITKGGGKISSTVTFREIPQKHWSFSVIELWQQMPDGSSWESLREYLSGPLSGPSDTILFQGLLPGTYRISARIGADDINRASIYDNTYYYGGTSFDTAADIVIDGTETEIADFNLADGSISFEDNIQSAIVTPAQKSYIYDGTPKIPDVTVVFNGKTLTRDTDYTVSYASNKTIGKANVTITGVDNYAGSKAASFKIVPKQVKVKKVSVGKKLVKVTWSKAKTSKKVK